MACMFGSTISRRRCFEHLATIVAPFLAAALIVSTAACQPRFGADGNFDPDSFATPPTANRPYVRWWWPGGAVDDAEIGRELVLLQQAGFGGVEIQPLLLGLTPAEIAADPNVRTVGT